MAKELPLKIQESELITCMAETPTSPDPDDIQSPMQITIEPYLDPALTANIALQNSVAKLIV